MSWRVRPNRDVYIVDDTVPVPLDVATAPAGSSKNDPRRALSSKVVIDATRHQEFPQASLPPGEHMEQVRAMWKEYGME